MKRAITSALVLAFLTSTPNSLFFGAYASAEEKAPAAAPAVDPNAAAPKIEFSEPVWDFGNVEFGTPAEHTFKVYNRGKATLMITDVKRSCGCTEPVLSSKEVKPGESADLKVAYDTTRKGPFDKQVTVMSNDPNNASAFIRIKGNVRADVEVNPMRVHFANVYRDDVEANKRTVVVNSSTVADLKIKDIKSDNNAIYTKFTQDAATKNWNVDVFLKPEAPLGNLNANLRVMTNSEKMPTVDVPVMAQVFGNIMLEPPRLFFGPKGPGEMQEGKITLTDRKNSGTFKVLGMKDSGDMLTMNVVTVKEGNQYTLEFKTKRTPENPGGYFNGNVEIQTNLVGEETLTIPYNGYIQPAVTNPENK